MNTRTLAGCVFLVLFLVTSGINPAMTDQADKHPKRVRFVCQAYDIFDQKFRNRVIIVEQTSTKSLSRYSPLDWVAGSSFIDLNSKDIYMGMTGTTEFRMRIYIATLFSDDKTEQEIIEDLLKKPGDFRVAKYEFQDPAPMDYTGTGHRDKSTFYFVYERKRDGFHKHFSFNLAKFYNKKVFDADNLRDLDTDSLKELENEYKDTGIPYFYPSMSTNAGSTTLMEDGNYICRKPVLI